MKFEIITIFPKIFEGFLEESLIKKALGKGLFEIKIHDLRKWAKDRHRTVDDAPFGGGRGMIFKLEPIYRAVASLKKSKIQNPCLAGRQARLPDRQAKSKIILFTPRGKKFDQKLAYQLSKMDRLIMICGRYEGIDERVAEYISDINLSIGDYVLMGGEIPAMAVIESIARLIPGVIGKSELLSERMTKTRGREGRGFIEYPQYTRPAEFNPSNVLKSKKGLTKSFLKAQNWRVPKILLSGDPKKIGEWRQKHSRIIAK